jgi:hypothetical protein
MFLKESRYPFFVGQWFVILFVCSVVLAHLYAWSRSTLGPAPGTAFKIGLGVGFAAGLPRQFWTSSLVIASPEIRTRLDAGHVGGLHSGDTGSRRPLQGSVAAISPARPPPRSRKRALR